MAILGDFGSPLGSFFGCFFAVFRHRGPDLPLEAKKDPGQPLFEAKTGIGEVTDIWFF